MHTASPVLGNLKFWFAIVLPERSRSRRCLKKYTHSLHLPQYMSYLVTGRLCSDITSIGCHTGMWNFTENHYHEWLQQEGIHDKLAPIFPSDQLINTNWNGTTAACAVPVCTIVPLP